MTDFSTQAPLGIIAGATELPHALARACKESGRASYSLYIENAAEPTLLDESQPHDWVRIGAIGKAIKLLRDQGVQDVIFAGKVSRPPLSDLRPDLKATMLLAKLGSSLLSQDDTLLRAIVNFFEDEGFNVVGVDEACPQMLSPEGVLTNREPSQRTIDNINFGVPIAKEVSRLDIGQCIIVQDQQVLGIEAIEGTDGLIRRCAYYRISKNGGVLVKVKKPHQERRADLPTMGVRTVEAMSQSGFSTIAIEAGHSIMIDRQAIIDRANELGIHIIGIDAGE